MMKQIFRNWDDSEERYVVMGKKKINLGKPIDYGNKTMTFRHPETGESIDAHYEGEFAGYCVEL